MNYQSPNFQNTEEDPEYEVRKVLAEIDWDGTLPIDLLNICEMNGIEYVFGCDPSMEEEGTTRFINEGDFYIFINTYGTDCKDGFSSNPSLRRRQRFTLAHEIAHCIYKSHTNIELQKALSDRSNPHSRKHIRVREYQANQFAAHLLIPRQSFYAFSKKVGWGNSLKLIEETAEAFDVSMEVAAQHIAEIANHACICILFNLEGNPKKVPTYSADFNETGLFYYRGQRVPRNTGAAQILDHSKNIQKIRKSFNDATIWFPDAHEYKAQKFSIAETSFQCGKYSVITFLEIEDNEIY